MLPESESTNATSWDPYFRKSFLYIPFLYKWMVLCLVSLVSTPAITTDVWVTGSLQGRACPPSQLSCCSHPDLSGQPVFGTFLGCFCHSMRLMTHAHISEVILGDKPCQWLPAHQRKTQVCLPHRSFFLWSWQGEEMQEGSRGEGEERKSSDCSLGKNLQWEQQPMSAHNLLQSCQTPGQFGLLLWQQQMARVHRVTHCCTLALIVPL